MTGVVVLVLVGAGLLLLAVLGYGGRLLRGPANEWRTNYTCLGLVGVGLLLLGAGYGLRTTVDQLSRTGGVLGLLLLVVGLALLPFGPPSWAMPQWQRSLRTRKDHS